MQIEADTFTDWYQVIEKPKYFHKLKYGFGKEIHANNIRIFQFVILNKYIRTC